MAFFVAVGLTVQSVQSPPDKGERKYARTMKEAVIGFFNRRHRYIEVFLFGALISAGFMVLYLVLDGAFMFYGDFNVQQIPFYIEANRAIREGSLLWNSTTDLGVNFIGSYSFYLLGSPFFWLTTLLPIEWVGYSLGYLYILKFACASLTGYLYIERFVKNKDYAMIGALLYAFSGYGIYNIFFNHFHEAMVFFPLLLLGMELSVRDGKRGPFAAAVFVNAFVNYYFFFGEVIFCVIYFVIRSISPGWQMDFKKFVVLATEAVIGLGMSCVLLIPSLVSVMGMSRSTSFINGWNALMYSSEQRYGLIIETFFFPPDIPARPNFFPSSDSKWASTAGWLPLFSMTGVIAYLQCRKKDWLKRTIWTSIFFAFIPILNASFSFFNYSYYSRWFYMPILLMALATVISLEDESIEWGRAFRWTAFITIFISVAIGLMPKKVTNDAGETVYEFGLYEYIDRFIIYVVIAFISLILFAALFYLIGRKSRWFTVSTMVSLTLITVIYANVFIMIGRAHSYDREWIRTTLIDNPQGIELPDEEGTWEDSYRIDVVPGSMDNIGLFWGIPSIHAFHSIVPSSVFDFYEAIGVDRGVGSRPEWNHQALRSLLSVKWLIDPDNDSGDTVDNYSGWTYVCEIEGYGIYRNENYIPMGFTYDSYITASSFETLSASQKEKIMLMAVVLEQSQAEKYGSLLSMIPITSEDEALNSAINNTGGNFEDSIDTPSIAPVPGVPSLSYDVLAQESDERAANSCKTFEYTNTGFTASIDLQSDNLVFFSVPYDDGWSAEVNGIPVEIEKVNVGFMAVLVPAGENNEIKFTYKTPGLELGIKITTVSVVIFAGYLITCAVIKRRRGVCVPDASEDADVVLEGIEPSLFEADEGEQFEETSVPRLPEKDLNDVPQEHVETTEQDDG